MATIDNLSPELLVEIFSHYIRTEGHEEFLRNIPQICKGWNKLSSDSSLWRNIKTCNPHFLMNVSGRGLLFYTQRLRLFFYDDRIISETNLSAVLESIEDLKAFDMYWKIACGDIIKLLTDNCPHLERLSLNKVTPMPTSNRWNQFLTVCGPTLKHLDLKHCFSWETGQQLVSMIAAKCPLLEKLVFIPAHDRYKTPFPILELQRGCPCLKELEFHDCYLITSERNDSLDCGFKELKWFSAKFSDFSGFDIYILLKDSINLEHLNLHSIINLVLDNVWKIPSDKVNFLSSVLQYPNNNLKALGDAVSKWRHTLLHLELCFVICDGSYIFERFLQDNPNPRITSLTIYGRIDPHFFKNFIQKCENLTRLQFNLSIYNGREKIKEAF